MANTDVAIATVAELRTRKPEDVGIYLRDHLQCARQLAVSAASPVLVRLIDLALLELIESDLAPQN